MGLFSWGRIFNGVYISGGGYFVKGLFSAGCISWGGEHFPRGIFLGGRGNISRGKHLGGINT